ncbi:MAG: D-alanine--D-alanine ligase family protein [Kiritimatiellia bacterium]
MKTQVAFFFGGRSVEHEVSVISAQQAMAALDRGKYDPVPVYISKAGTLHTGPELLDIKNFRDLPALLKRARQVTIPLVPGDHRLLPHPAKFLAKQDGPRMDVAIPVTHGTFGEDGCLQGVFEMIGLPYAGCDVAASAMGMDKLAAKRIWSSCGLPVVEWVYFESRRWHAAREEVAAEVESRLGYPVVIKPAQLGSSVGLNTARDRGELERGIEACGQFTQRILVERMIQPLREINCSVLGDADGAQPSPCEEPVRTKDVLSFADKYQTGGKSKGMTSTKRELPARIPDELTRKVQSHAVQAFQALRCAGVARIDFLYHEDSGGLWVNEINTIPGSLSFYLWQAGGIGFPELLERLIQLAFKRHRDQQKVSFSYDTNLLAGFSAGAKGKA